MKKRHKKKIITSKEKKNLSHKILIFSGFALLLFFLVTLSLEGVIKTVKYSDLISLILISILTISFISERFLKVKKVKIYEAFYSLYLSSMLLALAIIYWIAYLNETEIGAFFRSFMILTLVIFFLFSLLSIKHAEEIWFIVLSYIFAVLITIIVFAYLYWTMAIFGTGFLQFSDCSTLNPALNSENWFYFSSVTFYALGYGDICPILSPARFASQLEVALGALVNTILIGFIFWKIREKSVKEEVEKKLRR